ncbi:MAG: DUF4231 domain-containing protein [Terriglobia bacterium]
MAHDPGYDKALDIPWHAYRTWAGTARYLKAGLSRWTSLTLWLAIAGAVLAAAGQEFGAVKAFTNWPLAVKGVAILAAFTVALSAYFGKEALGGNKTADWSRARSAAESLKALVFLYRAGVPPFDATDREDKLFGLVTAIEENVATIEIRSAPPDAKEPDLSPLTVDGYIAQRVDDQIRYYDKRAGEYQKANDRLHNAVFCLGAVSVLLAVMAASGFVPALVGLIATLTASISAHAQNQQYQALIVIYQATSRRLLALKGEWSASHKCDADTVARNAFIRSCEDAMALENGAWTGEWSRKTPAPAAARDAAAPGG